AHDRERLVDVKDAAIDVGSVDMQTDRAGIGLIPGRRDRPALGIAQRPADSSNHPSNEAGQSPLHSAASPRSSHSRLGLGAWVGQYNHAGGSKHATDTAVRN